MDNFKTEVEASLAVLGADSIELLRRCDLLKSLVQLHRLVVLQYLFLSNLAG